MNTWITDSGRMADGFTGERNDCTARALAMLLNIRYAEAHAKLAALGRKPGRKFGIRRHVEALGLEQVPELSCRRVEAVLSEMPPGRFMIRVNGHCFAVVDGVINDMMEPKPRSVVKMAYRVKGSRP